MARKAMINTKAEADAAVAKHAKDLGVEKADASLVARLTALSSDALGKGFAACDGTSRN